MILKRCLTFLCVMSVSLLLTLATVHAQDTGANVTEEALSAEAAALAELSDEEFEAYIKELRLSQQAAQEAENAQDEDTEQARTQEPSEPERNVTYVYKGPRGLFGGVDMPRRLFGNVPDVPLP